MWRAKKPNQAMMNPMPEPRSKARRYLPFVAQVLAVTALLVGVGYVPTQRLEGDEGTRAMLAGCGISCLASMLGAIPVALGRASQVSAALNLATASMALRFLLVMILGVAAVLSGWFAKTPLLIWMGLSYMVLLIVDTRYVLTTIRDQGTSN